MTLFWNCLPLLLKGLKMTLALLILSGILSLTVGTLLGLFLSERLRVRVVSRGIDILTFIARAVPFYVQLLIVYFVLPEALGCNFDPFTASVIALGGCSAGYVAQVIRAAINGVSPIQWESAKVLGFTQRQAVWYVIVPQAIRLALPSLCNELESMLKSTSIVASIGLLELTRASMNLVSREMEPVPIYLMTALFYVLLSFVITIGMRTIEWRFSCLKSIA